jgi:hypothetical protein
MSKTALTHVRAEQLVPHKALLKVGTDLQKHVDLVFAIVSDKVSKVHDIPWTIIKHR